MTPDPDEAGLLRAIRADPAADLPRLVFCDFLQDRGADGDEARASLVRWQLEHPAALSHETLGAGYHAVRFDFRRGFAERARLRGLSFVGRVCGACAGAGAPPDASECARCAGVGALGGCARALFAEHPLTQVTLKDVLAVPRPDGGGWRYNVRHDVIPTQLARQLTARGADRATSGALAVAAGELACVEWGRSLAGLPPLTAEPPPGAGSQKAGASG